MVFISSAAIGCDKDHQLPTPDEMIIYSLDHLAEPGPKTNQEANVFMGYPVFGTVTIHDAGKRQELYSRLHENINRRNVEIAACFWPRHGVRLKFGNRVIDYALCFQCSNYRKAENGQSESGSIQGDSVELMNKYLTQAGVKLAPQPGE